MADETKIIRIIVDSSKAVDGSSAATRALEKLERSTASVDTALNRIEQGLGKVGLYLKAQLGLMVAELGARFVQMGKDSLTAVAGLDELAEQLGVTTAGLQALQYSAVQNGMKLEQLESGVSKFSQKMGEAAGGSKEMIEALNALGVKNLDIQGKLRPTQELMTEVAAAIVKIEDPAKRSAAAVDFFGKAGARMLPMLKDIAGGFDDMAAKAQRGGAMISKEAIEKLDKLADSAERGQLKMRALFAENAAGPLTEVLDFLTKKMENLSAIVKGATLDFSSLFKIAAGIASPGQLVGRILSSTPSEKLANDISGLQGKISGAEAELNGGNLNAMQRRLYERNLATYRPQLAALERQRDVMAVGGPTGGSLPSDPDGIGIYVPGQSKGASTSAIKGAGQAEADKIAKLMRDGNRDLSAANAEAAASERGARAVAELEIHFRALKSAQDAYGATADKNAASVGALTAKLEEQMRATERAKSLKDFNLGTEELEKANQLLAAENGLINASVEVRSRELAIIKLKQETQAKGLDENDPKERAAIERRHAAIEQNEKLKAQGEELRKANELWTAPLKSALESIQRTAADAFEGMLNSGKFSFEEMGSIFRKIITRMIAEFMALATIRPVMSVVVQALEGTGMVSAGSSSQLGFGGGGGGGGMFGMGGGGGGMSMPSMGGGGLGGMWANATGGNGFSGLFQGAVPSAGSGVMGPQMPGALNAASGLQMGSFGMSNVMGGVGIGMGALSLATNKKPTTASTIGGIGQMVGGALMMIPTPWTMAAGAVISMASSILPGLFGGGEEAPPYPATVYSGGVINGYNPARGFSASGSSANGGSSLAKSMAGTGQNLHSLYMSAAGGAGGVNAGLIWGGALGTGTNDRYNNQKPYINLDLFGPNGYQRRVLDSDMSRTPEQGADLLTRMAFYESLQGGGLPGASPYLLTAHRNAPPESVQELAKLIETVNAFTEAYNNLGKTTVSARDAIEALNNSFAEMSSYAASVGASLTPINAELEKQRTRVAQDFIDGMLDPMAVQMRALDDQRTDSLASAEYIRDNVKSVHVDIAKITEYWNQKRLDLEKQYQSASVDQAVASMQTLIRRLTYGDLANASPDTSLAGTRGAYTATLAQARAGSTSAADNLAGVAEAYATSARSYFASSPEYAELVAQIRRDLEERVGATGTSGGGATGGATNNDVTNAVLNANAELRSMFAAMSNDNAELKSQVAALVAQLARRA